MTKTRRAGFSKKRRRGGRKTVKRRAGSRRSRGTKRRRGGSSKLGYFGAPETKGSGLELAELGLRGGVGRHILLLVTLFHEDGFS